MHLHRRQRAREVLHGTALLACPGVVEDQMALGERASLGVLAGQPDRNALGQQGCEGERFRVGPQDAAPVVCREHLATLLKLLDQLWMDREAVGHRQQLLV